MTIELLITDVKLYGVLHSSEGLDVPMYKINYSITQQFIEDNRGVGGEIYFRFGVANEDEVTHLIAGYMLSNIQHAIEVADETSAFTNRVTNIKEFTTGANLYYKDELTITNNLKQSQSALAITQVSPYNAQGISSAWHRVVGGGYLGVTNASNSSSSYSSLLVYEEKGNTYIYPIAATLRIAEINKNYPAVTIRLSGTNGLQTQYNFKYIGLDGLNSNNWKNFTIDKLNGKVSLTPVNPYDPGGPSGPGGGNGSFDDDSDPIPIPSLPTLSSANTGFTRIYNPTLAQVQDLANYLWTDETVIQTIWNHVRQFFESPMDAIIGFNLVPVHVPDGGTKNFALMYIPTGVSMTVAASQFVDVDCGTLELKEYYGSALDYSPYTRITCYLPYIGQVTLNVDEVMGRTLQVTYRVDICSGSCVAYILVDGNALYQYSGHCAINIPVSSADFSSYVSAAISVAKLAGTAIAGVASAAASPAIEAATQQTNKVVTTTVNTQRNPSTGRQITVGTQTTTVERSADESGNTEASFGGILANEAVNTASQVMSSKTIVEHTGSFSGNSGYLGVRRPYIIIERPNMCMPVDYQKFNGFPSMLTLLLGECSGFTRVQQVQLTGLHCTNPEQAEILELLKMGVIF